MTDDEIRVIRDDLQRSGVVRSTTAIVELCDDLLAARAVMEPRLLRFDEEGMHIATRMAGHLADSFYELLQTRRAQNYVVMTFSASKDRPEVEVTLRRIEGKMPHELRKEAEAERDVALAALTEAREVLDAAQAVIAVTAPHHASTIEEARRILSTPIPERGRLILAVVNATIAAAQAHDRFRGADIKAIADRAHEATLAEVDRDAAVAALRKANGDV